jgi:hypothetical protein
MSTILLAEPASRRKSVDREWGKAMIINLPRGGILIIDLHQQELTIESREGRLWVTWTGGSPDYVLKQSDTCLLAGPGEVCIEALCPACLAVFGKTGFAMKVNARSVS